MIALRLTTGELIWIDAVLEYGKQYQNTVTAHPVETGANITDHVITQNAKFRVRGVISDADFNTTRPVMRLGDYSGDELASETTYKDFINNTPTVAVPVITFGKNPLSVGLPASIAQFIGDTTPTVTMSEDKKAVSAKSCMEFLYQQHKLRQTMEVVEYQNNGAFKVYGNMIMTGLSETLDPESGDAAFPDMTFEEVTYASSAAAKIPAKLVRNATAKKVSKGKVATKDSKKSYDFVKQQQDENASLSAKEQQQHSAEQTVKDGK